MYLKAPRAAKEFARALRRHSAAFAGVDVALMPPFPLIPVVAEALRGSKLEVGAQTLSAYEDGAHTGEVSAEMLKALGASAVIVGHSERRAEGETNDDVREKLQRAARAGLKAVLCIGEKERDASGDYVGFLTEQLSSALAGFPKASAGKLLIAYEPLWAIGKTAADAMKPAELRETSILIRKVVADALGREALARVAVLYGGSVEPENAPALIAGGDVSGFLVGHSSADVEPFLSIVKACRL